MSTAQAQSVHLICVPAALDTEGDDGGDRLQPRWDSHAGGVDQRRPHHHPFTGPAGHGYGTY